jgi:hypothetical protein
MKQHTTTIGALSALANLTIITTSDEIEPQNLRRVYQDGTVSTGPQWLELTDDVPRERNYRREGQLKQLMRMRDRVIRWANENTVYPRTRRVAWMLSIHYLMARLGVTTDIEADLETAAYGTSKK